MRTTANPICGEPTRAWMGEVPETWGVQPGRRLFQQTRFAANPKDEQLSATQKYGVVPQKLFMESEAQKVVLALSGTSNFKHVDVDDFVISLRSFQGGIERCYHSGCVSPAYTVLKGSAATVPAFFGYVLKSAPYIDALQAVTDGIREGKSISYAQFGAVPLPIPPLPEQVRIADFLDAQTERIDALIEEKERLLGLLYESLESAIEMAVLPEGEARLTPLKRVTARIVTGPFGSTLHSSDYIDGGVPVINPSHIVGDVLRPDTKVSITAEMADRLSAYRLSRDELIVGRRGEMGRCAVVLPEGEGWLCGTGCLVASPNPFKVLPHYLQLVVSSRASRDWLSLESVGSTMENLNAEILGRLPGFFPSLTEQKKRIVSAREAMSKHDSLMTHVEEHIGRLREYRSSLISAAVTGQIDINDYEREAA